MLSAGYSYMSHNATGQAAGRLVHEEANLVATKFIQTILEDTGWIDSLLWQTVPPIDDSLAEEMASYVQMAMMFNNFRLNVL